MATKRKKPTRRLETITPDTIIRVAIYIRRSTDDEHQPYSLEAQLQKLTAFVASQPGWKITLTFSDDASGATLDRPGLAKALAAARAGRYDLLLVYRLDRFSRRIRDLATLIDDLDAAGVAFRSATRTLRHHQPRRQAVHADARRVRRIRTGSHHRPGHRRHGTQSRQRRMDPRTPPLRLPR
jgi:site-specific DNA recombinase